MTRDNIKTNINQSLAGDQLTWKQMLVHINWAIDLINSNMNTCFPEVDADTEEYTAIPDKYIRQVVIPGAVHHFYIVDDEGTSSEGQFLNEMNNGMFFMLRDYSHAVPEEYQADVENGTIDSAYEDSWGLRGIWL